MRRTLGAVAVAVLCVVALGLVAATITTPVGPGGGSEDERDDREFERPDGEGTGNATVETVEIDPADVEGDGLCVGATDRAETVPLLLVIAASVSTMVFVYSRNLQATLVAFPAAFLPLFFVVLLLAAGCSDPSILPELDNVTEFAGEGEPGEQNGGGGAGEGESVGDEEGPSPAFSLELLAPLGLFAAVAVLVALAVRRRSDDVAGNGGGMGTAPVEEAIGEAAGEAADRIAGQAGLENEVYRAWAEMAALLDVEEPETSTPAEFARAALEAGLEPGDVDELTRLFEEVRYGNAPVTEERERRAVEALRRIERRYTGED